MAATLVASALAACGGRAQNQELGSKTFAAGAAGLENGAQSGQSGAAGEATNIAGRWAMFTFEDPVGVELSEAEGALSGQGCAGGVPSLNDPHRRVR